MIYALGYLVMAFVVYGAMLGDIQADYFGRFRISEPEPGDYSMALVFAVIPIGWVLMIFIILGRLLAGAPVLWTLHLRSSNERGQRPC